MNPPVFAHGHLRLYILSLLSESETGMHGYELIQALGDRFGGTYVPSAGTIYPRLAKLETERLVDKNADGRKTVYTITSAGRAELAAREGELDGIENGVTDSIRRLADEVRSSVNEAMKSLKADLAATARETREAQREARSEVHEEPEPGPTVGSESRARLQRADMALQSFRHDVRSDLRDRVARGELSEESVTLLESRLTQVRAELLASFTT
jgi:DNA-binding PadR family transcriptional regulator